MKKPDSLSNIWKQYHESKDPKLKEQLILAYAPTVKYVAGRLSIHLGQHMDFDDLVSYGIFGLIDAIDKFDTSREVKFETYASLRIRGAIIDNIRNMDWVPRTLRQKSKKFEQVYTALESDLGREPTEQELAQKLNITLEETRDLIRDSSVISLVSLEDVEFDISSEDDDTPENSFNKQELRTILIETIENLTLKERLVVTLHYFEELTLREISKVLEVTESRVSQIHSKALIKMKGRLGNHKAILFS